MRGRYIFFLHLLIAIIVSSIFAIAAAQFAHKPNGLNVEYVRLGDILATLIAVTGITIPMLVGYSSIKNSEILQELSERARSTLSRNNITVPNLSSAYLYRADAETDGDPSHALLVVYELVTLGSAAKRKNGIETDDEANLLSLDEICKKTLLPESRLYRIYTRYFERHEDKIAAIYYISALAFLAFYCFITLIVRYLGVDSNEMWQVEIFFLILTFLANAFTYLFLTLMLLRRSAVVKLASMQVRILCSTLSNEVADSVAAIERLKNDFRLRIDALVEGLSPDSAGGTRPGAPVEWRS